MKKINIIAGVFFLSIIYQSAQALPPTKPNKCPSPAAIKARGFDLAEQTYDGWSVGVLEEFYDTNVPFTFVVGAVFAQDEDSAKKAAVIAIENIRLQEGPTYHESSKSWHCTYTGLGYPAAAWTPSNRKPKP